MSPLIWLAIGFYVGMGLDMAVKRRRNIDSIVLGNGWKKENENSVYKWIFLGTIALWPLIILAALGFAAWEWWDDRR